MRRLLLLFLLPGILVTSAGASTDPLQLRVRAVRSGVIAAEAWNADHGTYAGMTLAKLRRAYDRTLKGFRVPRATRKGYCVQSALKPLVHYDGPRRPDTQKRMRHARRRRSPSRDVADASREHA